MRQIYAFVVRELGARLRGHDGFYCTVAHSDGVMLQDRARRLDRYDPAGAEEKTVAYLGVPWTSTTTRRFGDRHSISPLRSFWSGQDLTGSVLPKPSVSTLSAPTPLETR